MMSVKIHGDYNNYKMEFPEVQKAKEERDINSQKKEDIAVSYSKKKSTEESDGLYQLTQDKNGKAKILYHNPNKKDDMSEEDNRGQQKVKDSSSNNESEECTMSTDKVDREIQKMKEKKKQLEQEIKAASEDEGRIKELKKQLAQVESELNQKDNDTYRKQNASIL